MRDHRFLLLISALCFVAIGAMVAAVMSAPKEALPMYRKVATTQIGGNGGFIDGYEYKSDDIVCFIQIHVVPNMSQTYSNVSMDCTSR